MPKNTFESSGGEQNIAQGDHAIGKQVNIKQDVQGDGNIVAGSGPVHVEHHHYPTPPPVIPDQRPALEPCFLHRDEELVWLLNALHPGKVAAICGPGGMGKSALASKAVHQLEPTRFPDGIIFHSFYHQPSTEQALQAICAAFQVEAKTGLESAVRQVLLGRKALLMLDGTEQAEDLKAVLALRGSCGVLITSRRNEDALDELLELKRLEEKQAAEVFRRYNGLVGDDANVQGICKILDGWPVGLRIAGRYLRKTKESAADYLRWLEKEPFKELDDGEHQEENAALLLRRSMAQVSEDARLALGVAGTLAFAPIAREPMAAILDSDERRARAALNELVNYGLLDRKDERWQTSHALIHTYARTELALNKENLERLARIYIQACQAASKAGLEGYAFLDAERKHCLRLIENCLESKLWQEVKAVAGAMWEYLDRQGWWTDQLAAVEMRLKAARQAGDRDDERYCLAALGYTCWRCGESDKALAWHEQSLLIARELGDRQNEGIALNNIAMIYQQQGKHELALETYQQSLSIKREIGDRKGEGVTLNNIAGVYHAQGDYEQALSYYEQCLPIVRKVGNTIGEGTTLNNIAAIYDAQGKPAKALKYHEQALGIRQELGDRAGETVTRWNIGLTYKDMGDLAKAEEYMSQAVQIAEQMSHPELQTIREGLALVRAKRRGQGNA